MGWEDDPVVQPATATLPADGQSAEPWQSDPVVAPPTPERTQAIQEISPPEPAWKEMAFGLGLSPQTIAYAASRAADRGGDFDTHMTREVRDEALVSDQGLSWWAQQNPEDAKRLASMNVPSRNDFEQAGLPRRSAADRQRVAASLKAVLAEPGADTTIPQTREGGSALSRALGAIAFPGGPDYEAMRGQQIRERGKALYEGQSRDIARQEQLGQEYIRDESDIIGVDPEARKTEAQRQAETQRQTEAQQQASRDGAKKLAESIEQRQKARRFGSFAGMDPTAVDVQAQEAVARAREGKLSPKEAWQVKNALRDSVSQSWGTPSNVWDEDRAAKKSLLQYRRRRAEKLTADLDQAMSGRPTYETVSDSFWADFKSLYREGPAPVAKWKDNKGAVSHIGAALGDTRPPFDIAKAIQAGVTLKAVKNLQDHGDNDYPGRDADEQLLEAVTLKALQSQYEGQSTAGMIAGGLAAMPSWMAEFAATGSIMEAAKKGAIRLGEKAVGKFAKKKAVQIALKIGGETVGAMARQPALAPNFVADALRRQIPEITGVDDKGRLVLGDVEKPATAWFKAFGTATIEALSERAGESITDVGSKILGKIPGARPVMARVANALRKVFPKGGTLDAALTKGGYSSWPGEMSEEGLAKVLHAAFGTDPSMKGQGLLDRWQSSIPSGQEILVTSAVLAFPGATKAGMALAGGAVRMAPAAARGAREAFGNDAERTLTHVFAPEQFPDGVEILKVEDAAAGKWEVTYRVGEAPKKGRKDKTATMTVTQEQIAEAQAAMDEIEKSPEQKAAAMAGAVEIGTELAEAEAVGAATGTAGVDTESAIQEARRQEQFQLPRPGQSEKDAERVATANTNAVEREVKHNGGYVLASVPVEEFTVAGTDVDARRQGRLTALGGSSDPVFVVAYGISNKGKPVLAVENGNNRVYYAKNNGIKTVDAFVNVKALQEHAGKPWADAALAKTAAPATSPAKAPVVPQDATGIPASNVPAEASGATQAATEQAEAAQDAAARLGITYNGPQEGPDGEIRGQMFTDTREGKQTTFMVKPGQSIDEALTAKRAAFDAARAAAPAPSPEVAAQAPSAAAAPREVRAQEQTVGKPRTEMRDGGRTKKVMIDVGSDVIIEARGPIAEKGAKGKSPKATDAVWSVYGKNRTGTERYGQPDQLIASGLTKADAIAKAQERYAPARTLKRKPKGQVSGAGPAQIAGEKAGPVTSPAEAGQPKKKGRKAGVEKAATPDRTRRFNQGTHYAPVTVEFQSAKDAEAYGLSSRQLASMRGNRKLSKDELAAYQRLADAGYDMTAYREAVKEAAKAARDKTENKKIQAPPLSQFMKAAKKSADSAPQPAAASEKAAETEPKVTRESLRSQIQSAFKLSDEQTDAAMALADSAAARWSKLSGRDASDFYAHAVSEVTTKAPKGMNLLQKNRAAVTFAADGTAIIHAMKGAQVASVVHEFAHIFHRQLELLASQGISAAKADMQRLAEWTGEANTAWDSWSRSSKEKVARAFERYLRDGKAPTEGLRSTFARFKAWLTDIYKAIKGSLIDVKVTPEVRMVFDRLLGGEGVAPEATVAGEADVLSQMDSLLADPAESFEDDSGDDSVFFQPVSDRGRQQRLAVASAGLKIAGEMVQAGGKLSFATWAKALRAKLDTINKPLSDMVPDSYLARMWGHMASGDLEHLGESQLSPATRDSMGTVPSKAAEWVDALAVERGLQDESGNIALRQHEQMSMKEQAEMVAALPYDQAERIALGEESPPPGLRVGSVFVAVANQATLDGNVALVLKLANSKALDVGTAAGQEIKAFDARDPLDPVKALRHVMDSARAKQEANAGEADSKQVADLQAKLDAVMKSLDEAAAKIEAAQADAKLAREAAKQPRTQRDTSKNKTYTDERTTKAKQQLKALLASNEVLYQAQANESTALDLMTDLAGSYIESGGKNNARWKKDMVAEFGERVLPLMDSAWTQARKQLAPQIRAEATKNIGEKLKAGGSLESMQQDARDLYRLAITDGVEGIEARLDYVYENLKDADSSLTREEVRDAISGYSKIIVPNQAAVEVELRDNMAQHRELGKLRDISQGNYPAPTGFQVDEPSQDLRDVTRKAQQEKRAAEKAGRITPPAGREKHLKSGLESAVTRLKNQIADLDAQITAKKRNVKKRTAFDSAELRDLRQVRDEKKAVLDQIDPRVTTKTDEQKIEIANRYYERRIAQLNEKLAGGDFVNAPKATWRDAEDSPEKQLALGLEKQAKELSDELRPLTGFILSREQAEELVRLASAAQNARKQKDAGPRRGSNDVWGTESELAYGRAAVDFQNFVVDLHRQADHVTWGDFKAHPVEHGFRAITKTVESAVQIGRTLKAAFDDSFIGRQGRRGIHADMEDAVGFLLHGRKMHAGPKFVWTRSLLKSFKFIFDTFGDKNVMDEIKANAISDPNYERMKAGRLGIGGNEELFNPPPWVSRLAAQAQQWATKPNGLLAMRAIRQVLGSPATAFVASENAFNGTAHFMRQQLFNRELAIAESKGLNIDDPRLLLGLGRLVNAQTARGEQKKGHPVIDFVLWTPRMILSHIDTLTLHARDITKPRNERMTAYARWRSAVQLLEFVGSTAGLIMLFRGLNDDDEPFDLTNPDSLKGKIGNTRFDLTGGVGALVVLGARLATGRYTSSTTGQVTDLGASEFGQKNRYDALIDFMGNKFAPMPSEIAQHLKGEDRSLPRIGGKPQKPTVLRSIGRQFIPLPLETSQELLADPDAAPFLASMIADALGVSVNTYPGYGPKVHALNQKIWDAKQSEDADAEDRLDRIWTLIKDQVRSAGDDQLSDTSRAARARAEVLAKGAITSDLVFGPGGVTPETREEKVAAFHEYYEQLARGKVNKDHRQKLLESLPNSLTLDKGVRGTVRGKYSARFRKALEDGLPSEAVAISAMRSALSVPKRDQWTGLLESLKNQKDTGQITAERYEALKAAGHTALFGNSTP